MLAPSLHPKVARSIEQLAEMGISLDPAEVVWLANLAAALDAGGGSPVVNTGAPLTCGGVDFYPLHLLADSWLARWFPRFDGNSLRQSALFMLAHLHSEEGDRTLETLTDYAQISDLADNWLPSLPFTEDQLDRLFDALVALGERGAGAPITPPDKKAAQAAAGMADPCDGSDFMASILETFGGDPAYWETKKPVGYILNMFSARARAYQAGETDAGEAPDLDDPRIIAEHNYIAAIKWIIYRHDPPTSEETPANG